MSEPYARVERVGRFTYRITVHDGATVWGPGMMGVVVGWTRWGRRRAERKASKVLALYRREQERRNELWRVTR